MSGNVLIKSYSFIYAFYVKSFVTRFLKVSQLFCDKIFSYSFDVKRKWEKMHLLFKKKKTTKNQAVLCLIETTNKILAM